MSYQVHNFQTGDVIEAFPINEMDEQIQLNETNIAQKIDISKKGAANGVAELDENGKVPTSQLPSYVDDVLEYNSRSDFPATGEAGKIYVAKDTNLTYRWSGSDYVEISPSLALGETSATAYRGDRGKTAYDHATESGKISAAASTNLYKISVTGQGHIGSVTPAEKADLVGLGVLDGNQGAANAGKFMKVDTDGSLVPSDVDMSSKADKPSNPTNGDLAALDANGNLTDSGKKASDFLTQHQDISGKLDKDQGSANAGKALGINAQGMVVPVPFSGDDFTGATASTAGVHGYVPAPAAGDQGKFLRGDATWGNVPNPQVMTGATSSTNGASGLVPAPQAGDQAKALFGDGTWKQVADPADFTGATASTAGTHGLVPAPLAGEEGKVLYGSGDWDVAPGARIIQVTTTVTNTSGSYTATISDNRVSADMKALSLEIANPWVFTGKITVTCNTGSVTLSCDEVEGTSAVTINIIKAALNTATITSEEFDILNAGKVDKTDFYATEMQISTTDSRTVAEAISGMSSGIYVVTLDAVTNASGSYTHTTTVSGMTGDLKAVKLECSDPTIFRAPVSIVTGADSVTLTCSNVVGSSTVKASFLSVGNGNPLSSSEYAALDTRIGQLADLDTTDKTDIVSAINELDAHLSNIPKKIVTQNSYYTDYTYNTWVSHSVTFSGMTTIENAFVGAISGASTSTPHEVKITSISGNKVNYIGKGMWNGGAAGITATITAIGT